MKSISKKLIILGFLELIVVILLFMILLTKDLLTIALIIGWLGVGLFATVIMIVNFYEKLEIVNRKDWLIIFLMSLFLLPLGLVPFVIGVWLYWKRRLRYSTK